MSGSIRPASRRTLPFPCSLIAPLLTMPLVESRRVRLDSGINLNVADFGGDGPPLVMLHSTGFGAWMWQPMAAELTRHFRLLAPEQRGHGDSDKTEDGYDFRTLAGDMDALFDALGLTEIYGIGHSSGGTTLAIHAALYPGRIQRLLLVEPVLPRLANRSSELGPNPMAERTRKRRPVFESPEAMFDSFKGRPPFGTWQEEALILYCEEGTSPAESGVALKCPPEYEARFYEAVGRADVMPLLQELTLPIRTLWGQGSDIAPNGARMRENSLPGDAKTIPGTTHFIPMERPDIVIIEALDFLREDRS
jgi:pimeloyl-ACP methyl ester carboxylesterase